MHGGTGALLSREVGSGAVGRVGAPEPSRARRQGPVPRDIWQRWSPPVQAVGDQHHGARGNVWLHALLSALAWSLYVGLPSAIRTQPGS
jgi:hypothetical protein